jgi:putative endonuclease
MGDTRAAGRRGERATVRYLIRRGWTIVARNWLGPGGELDIVCRRRGVLMLCEVKARGATDQDVLRPAQVRRLAATFALFRQNHASQRDVEVRMALFTVDLGRRPLRVRLAYEFDDQ